VALIQLDTFRHWALSGQHRFRSFVGRRILLLFVVCARRWRARFVVARAIMGCHDRIEDATRKEATRCC
jgi:hypothetical protein